MKPHFSSFGECGVHSFIAIKPAISQMSRLFANGPVDRGLIQGRVIPKTQKTVLDVTLLSTQHYKVKVKSKVEQSRELSSALPYSSV